MAVFKPLQLFLLILLGISMALTLPTQALAHPQPVAAESASTPATLVSPATATDDGTTTNLLLSNLATAVGGPPAAPWLDMDEPADEYATFNPNSQCVRILSLAQPGNQGGQTARWTLRIAEVDSRAVRQVAMHGGSDCGSEYTRELVRAQPFCWPRGWNCEYERGRGYRIAFTTDKLCGGPDVQEATRRASLPHFWDPTCVTP